MSEIEESIESKTEPVPASGKLSDDENGCKKIKTFTWDVLCKEPLERWCLKHGYELDFKLMPLIDGDKEVYGCEIKIRDQLVSQRIGESEDEAKENAHESLCTLIFHHPNLSLDEVVNFDKLNKEKTINEEKISEKSEKPKREFLKEPPVEDNSNFKRFKQDIEPMLDPTVEVNTDIDWDKLKKTLNEVSLDLLHKMEGENPVSALHLYAQQERGQNTSIRPVIEHTELPDNASHVRKFGCRIFYKDCFLGGVSCIYSAKKESKRAACIVALTNLFKLYNKEYKKQ